MRASPLCAVVVLIFASSGVSAQSPPGRDLGTVTVRVLPRETASSLIPGVATDQPVQPNQTVPEGERNQTPGVERESEEAEPVSTSEKPRGLAGDCDGSASLSVADAQCALDMSAGLRVVSAKADFDGDGKVTSGDARALLQNAVGARP